MPTKTTKARSKKQKRTEDQILAEIYKLTEELDDRMPRSMIRCAIQEIRDRRNGKDASF